jgi:hypothetical protein
VLVALEDSFLRGPGKSAGFQYLFVVSLFEFTGHRGRGRGGIVQKYEDTKVAMSNILEKGM